MSRKGLALALQGGGSHGAYTWGVLDRLLEDDTIEIEALSGASAGAVNAVVFAHGYTEGGREGAKRALETFWNTLGHSFYGSMSAASGVQRSDPAARGYLLLSRFFSPYQLNPLNVNPLREILAQQIDFEALRGRCRLEVFISATRVSDGGLRIFSREELTLDALLASACLPSMHHSVEIDAVAYWDGGLAANPPVSVLVYKCEARDILVVVLNPHAEDGAPTAAEAIGERLKQISFSSTLSTELHAVALARAKAQSAWFAPGRVDRRLSRLNLHMMDSGAYLASLDPASRLNTDLAFVELLHREGRKQADAWLARNATSLGARSTFRFDRVFSRT